ncbi:MAG: aspartate ammonia-lyase [Defluviitaleaceae bacterium]|nr:aspartate ammonia-lyase [Defluviitaleaceae bacterium]
MSEIYRMEIDPLGERKVPKGAYYGPQTSRALENFPITGYGWHSAFISAIGMVKTACAKANMDVGLLDPAIGKYIVVAAEEVAEGKHNAHFVVDAIQGGAGTSFNMNANEVIANVALEKMGLEKGDYKTISPNDHINMSQSTNDVVPTSAFVAAHKEMDKLLATVERMIKTLEQKAEELDHVVKIGRTHLQDAAPIRLGQEFKAWAEVLKRDYARMGRTTNNLLNINLGATAVGTGLNSNPKYIKLAVKYLSEITRYGLQTPESLVDATQNSDNYTAISASLKITMINMSKIANDIRLMASGPFCGFREIHLPERQAGSSIMPGKVNPVMPELINQVAFQVLGNDNTICLAAQAGQLELNVMGPVLVFNLMQSITIMNNAFDVFDRFCLQGITANEEYLQEKVAKSATVATALNVHIGYNLSAEIAKMAHKGGHGTVKQICLSPEMQERIKKETGKYLSEKDLDIILNPAGMTEMGIPGEQLLDKK